MQIGIHISHEAAKKIGGIGSVLSGICNTESYQQFFSRTIFYGPLFDDQSSLHPERLGKEANVLFSSLDGINEKYPQLHDICYHANIDIVYGTKKIFDEIHPTQSTEVEVILVGVKRLKIEKLNSFKFQLWEKFQFQSDLYNDWDCEQYVRLAVPFVDIIQALAAPQDEIVAFSHEYMGVPCCLKLLLSEDINKRTYFYAHEVSTARALVEKLPGHDITFYNLMKRDLENSLPMEDRYGSQKNNYRNELIKLATNFDSILAVGDWIEKEYAYLQPIVDREKIHIVYNGVPTNNLSFDDKISSRKRLIEYCNNLYNFTPDIIFTHVTRLVISKGLWRDIRFLEEMDKYFAENNMKGFYILLSSLISTGRDPAEIERMESEYGWPVLHQEGYPDLIDYERDVYSSIKIFNAKSRAIKGVFINQYGFSPETTGKRIPAGTSFSDLRYGSDVELGFSIYEPFGIAQIETVPFGGIAVLSRQCGCSFLLDVAFRDAAIKPYYYIDFSEIDIQDENKILNLSYSQRTELEHQLFEKHSKRIFDLLPKDDQVREELLKQAHSTTESLSWESNIAQFFSSLSGNN
ncbi:MAG: hypothetical protein K0B81_01015 [Candidatus Cloacimonetes bacterium]|nr:hypothetical protein [Candidatus Cloacimonadota bacterium]